MKRSAGCLRTAAAILAFALLWIAGPARGQEGQTQAQPNAHASAGPKAVPAYRKANTIAVIPIEGEIDTVTVWSLERRLESAREMGADAVIIELNTFGGDVVATMNLCEMLRQSPVPLTVAWVRPKAYSAGTYMALACKEIVMGPQSVLGNAAPILPMQNMAPTERAKMESPLLAEVVDSARRRGYDENLVQAFVRSEVEVWLVQNKENGERIFVDRSEYELLFGDAPPETISGRTDLAQPGQVRSFWIGEFGERINTRERGMTEEERKGEVEAQQTLEPSRAPITASDKGKYVLVKPVDGKNTLLTLYTEEAIDYGIAKAQIGNDEELREYFGATKIVRINATWSEGMVRFLTSIPVRGLLLVLCIVGFIWEMAAPGTVVPGAVGVVALVLLLGAPFLTGLAGWWDIVFVVLGIGLLGVEMFVLPGFGLAGIAGFFMLTIGFVGTFVAPDPGGGILPTNPEAVRSMLTGVYTLLVGGGIAGACAFMIVRHFGTIPGLSRLVHTGRLGEQTGRADAAAVSVLGAMEMERGEVRLKVGAIGRALTPLRPVGKAEFEGQIHEVSAGRGAIESNRMVRVTSVSPLRIVVEEEGT